MPALTLTLDDQITDGLVSIDNALKKVGETTLVTAKTAERFNDLSQRQTVIIQQQARGYSELAATSVRVFGDISVAGVKAFESITLAVVNTQAYMEQLLVKEGASLIRWSIGATVALGGMATYLIASGRSAAAHAVSVGQAAASHERLGGVINRNRGAMIAGGAALADQTVGYGLLGKAAETAGKAALNAATGAGPYVLGATIAWKGYEMILARTGARMVTLADGSTKMETNLDRVQSAMGNFSKSVSRDIGEAGEAIQYFYDKPWFDFTFGLKEAFDKDVTMRTDNMIENIGHLNKAYNDGVIEMRAYFAQMTGSSYQGYKDEITVVRELREAHANLEEQRNREKTGFKNIRDMNQWLEDQEKKRAESARLNSIKTVAGIDDEIRATREKAAETARAGNMDEETSKQFGQRLNWLAERRITVEKQVADAAKKAHEAKKSIYTEAMRMSDEQSIASTKLLEVERKRVANWHEMGRAIGFALQDQKHENQLARAKEQLEVEKELTAARMKLGGSKDSQIKAQQAAMDKQFAKDMHADRLKQIDIEAQRKLDSIDKERERNEKTGGTAHERAMAESKLLADRDKVLFERRKARIDETGKYQREMIEADANKFKEAELQKFRAEEERIAKVKSLTEKTFDAQKVMQAADPKKVLKAIQDQRAEAAMNAQGIKDEQLFLKGEAGDKAAMRQFDRNQDRAAKIARKGVMNDFESGNLKDNEVSSAQNKVAQETLTTLQKQGKLSDDQTKAMIDVLKTLANQQQSIDNADATMQQIINFSKGLKSQSAKTTQSTASQVGSLN